MKIPINISKSVSFTGHREIAENYDDVFNETYYTVVDLCEKGYNTFLVGMAQGFDLLAAMVILKLKKSHIGINLVSVVPFKEQPSQYSMQEIEQYDMILEQSDAIVTISENYYKDVYFHRNDYLIENASLVICYYTARRSGTMYTVNRANKAGMPIINIYEKLKNERN